MRRSNNQPPLNFGQLLAGLAVVAVAVAVSVWIWWRFWYWDGYSELQTLGINLLVLAAIPILYMAYRAVFQPSSSTTVPPPAPPSGNPAPGAPPRPTGLFGWADDWLRWMGNGETHRGTLVVLVCVFWSILYWNWPAPDIQRLPFVLTFPAWGLLTIFGLVAIRQSFFRQTNLPSQEVSAAGDMKKSK